MEDVVSAKALRQGGVREAGETDLRRGLVRGRERRNC